MNRLTRRFGVLGIAGFLISAGMLFGQSKEDLRRKYGEPLSEVFMVRPDISVTAIYGTNGRIIELLISPHITDIIKSRGATLSQDSVNTIINELVPDSDTKSFRAVPSRTPSINDLHFRSRNHDAKAGP